MTLRWDTRLVGLATMLLVLLLGCALSEPESVVAQKPESVVAQGPESVLAQGLENILAQGLDPASTVGAYAAALNAHDLAAGLALFDQYGSATDEQGRHFEGRAGLSTFLLGSGFGDPAARVSTDHLRVLGNRAVWTYACSCADGLTEVRLVLNQDKISVFFMSRLPAASAAAARTAAAAQRDNQRRQLAIGLGVGLALSVSTITFVVRRKRPTPRPPLRAAQGSLLATLAQSRRLAPRGEVVEQFFHDDDVDPSVV